MILERYKTNTTYSISKNVGRETNNIGVLLFAIAAALLFLSKKKEPVLAEGTAQLSPEFIDPSLVEIDMPLTDNNNGNLSNDEFIYQDDSELSYYKPMELV